AQRQDQWFDGSDGRGGIAAQVGVDAVVEDEDVAGAGSAGEAGDDFVGRGCQPVQAAAAPGDQGVPGAAQGAGDVAGADAQGRPEEGGPHADDFLYQIVGVAQLSFPVGTPAHHAEVGVVEAVVGDDVALVVD